MARGFVKKRGSTWYAYWRDLEGRQRTKAIGHRKKDAEAYLTEIQSDLLAGTYQETKEATFADFALRWLEDYATVNVKPSTLLNYRNMTKNSLIPFFGARKLSAIRTEDVQRFVAELSQGRAPATVRKNLGVLKTMLKTAVLWGYLRADPAAPVKPPRIPHREMDFMTPAEIRLFLKHTENEYRAIFAVAIFTGMRLGELIGLQWDDVDWSSGTIRVQRSVWNGQFQSPKSRRSVRRIVMSPTLANILLQHKTTAPASKHDLIFCSRDGTFLDPSNLRTRVYEPALRRAGLRKMRIHDLRHTFASLLINQGENLKFVQSQLGHASITTTVDRYGHLMPDSHRGVGERLDAAVFGSVAKNLDDKMLTSGPENKKAGELVSLRPAVSLVAGTGFEPVTFGL